MKPAPWIKKLLLLSSTLLLLLGGLEGVLRFLANNGSGRLAGIELPAPIPPELDHIPAERPGNKKAFYWQGHLHVLDQNGMRRTEPFPPRRKDTARIAVLGDSLTYGHGVAAGKTYPAELEKRLLEKGYKVEVLNLGVGGLHSDDIAEIARDFIPTLKPDLVLYGICLNDFLEKRMDPYSNLNAWKFPLPESLKKLLTSRLMVGMLVSVTYNQFLMSLGIRSDFYDDILENIDRRQERFAHDLHVMQACAEDAGLPPIIAMVLLQSKKPLARKARLAAIAESKAAEAGMTVIPSESYASQLGDRNYVSQWERHPGEGAHAVFAQAFSEQILRTDFLDPYR